jgi:hypothetical protein
MTQALGIVCGAFGEVAPAGYGQRAAAHHHCHVILKAPSRHASDAAHPLRAVDQPQNGANPWHYSTTDLARYSRRGDRVSATDFR